MRLGLAPGKIDHKNEYRMAPDGFVAWNGTALCIALLLIDTYLPVVPLVKQLPQTTVPNHHMANPHTSLRVTWVNPFSQQGDYRETTQPVCMYVPGTLYSNKEFSHRGREDIPEDLNSQRSVRKS